LQKLKKITGKKNSKEPSWVEVVSEAKKRNLLMNEVGSFVSPRYRNNRESGNRPYFAALGPYEYFGWGVCCSEVEIDILTGEIVILRTDMIYDTGTTINMLIDIGQVEGAFVMGLGYLFREEIILSPEDGNLVSDSTWEYKPPCSLDIPVDFRVNISTGEFLDRPFGMKGSGEPPVLFSYSAASALKLAINSSRTERGLEAIKISSFPLMIDRLGNYCGIRKEDLNIEGRKH